MDTIAARDRLQGCYVTIPTMFRDPDLEVDLEAIRRHVRFLIDGGLVDRRRRSPRRRRRWRLLDADLRGAGRHLPRPSSTEAAGRVPIAMGGQTTSTRELVRLVQAAEQVGADYVQVSPPFYFAHTEGDFEEYILAAADAADVGLIVYNTYWTSVGVSSAMVERLVDVPNVVVAQVVDGGHGHDGLRADRQPVLRPFRDHRQPDALRDEPHPRRAGDRDPRRQLLAGLGGRAVADARARRVRRGAARDGPGGDAVHGRCGGR